jgi:ribulose-5-phosphate 4-epimerase/fuculose-1-phosphate aldolase
MADLHVAQLQTLREKVAKACRMIGKLEITKGTTGHISARVPGTDTVLIRARGPGETGVRFTSAEDVILVDLDGKKLDGAPDLDPPQEVFIHTWIYRTRPEVGSVLHAHPATAVLFTICKKPLQPLYGAYDPTSLRLLMEGIPTYPRSVLVSNDALGKELAEVMGKRACLMRGHGITTCGPSVEEATMTAIQLNDLAEMNYRAQLLGDPEPIPDEEIALLTSAAKVKEAKDAKDVRGPAMWRYYCKLAGEEL